MGVKKLERDYGGWLVLDLRRGRKKGCLLVVGRFGCGCYYFEFCLFVNRR